MSGIALAAHPAINVTVKGKEVVLDPLRLGDFTAINFPNLNRTGVSPGHRLAGVLGRGTARREPDMALGLVDAIYHPGPTYPGPSLGETKPSTHGLREFGAFRVQTLPTDKTLFSQHKLTTGLTSPHDNLPPHSPFAFEVGLFSGQGIDLTEYDKVSTKEP